MVAINEHELWSKEMECSGSLPSLMTICQCAALFRLMTGKCMCVCLCMLSFHFHLITWLFLLVLVSSFKLWWAWRTTLQCHLLLAIWVLALALSTNWYASRWTLQLLTIPSTAAITHSAMHISSRTCIIHICKNNYDIRPFLYL